MVATIPAVIVGFFLEKELKRGFGAPVLAAGFLIANGVMLFAAERLRRGRHDRPLARLRWTDALIIGSSVPLMPGTLVRFAETPGVRSVEGTSPDPSRSGLEAGITPPGGRMPAASGRTGAGARRTSPASGSSYPPAQTQSGGGNATPF